MVPLVYTAFRESAKPVAPSHDPCRQAILRPTSHNDPTVTASSKKESAIAIISIHSSIDSVAK